METNASESILETPRLFLRRFTAQDGPALYEYLSMEGVLRWLHAWDCTPEACAEVAAERATGDTYWAVCLPESGKLVGHVELRPVENPAFHTYEIGCVFHPHYGGKGLAGEACGRVLAHGFSGLSAHRIIATADGQNIRAQKLLRRLGMRQEAHFRKCLFLRAPKAGQPANWRDELHYALLAEEWKAEAPLI